MSETQVESPVQLGTAAANLAKSSVTPMRSVREAISGPRRDRIRQLGVVLVGTSSPLLRSLSLRRELGDRQPDAELEEAE